MFEMQVLVEKKDRYGDLRSADWVSVTPSHSDKPYRYKTKEEAEHMLWICYSEHMDKARVVEVQDG